MMTEWAAAAMKLVLWGALMAADVDRPPAKCDHPCRGHVQYVYLALDDGEFLWGS
jgi:hypothetical protein